MDILLNIVYYVIPFVVLLGVLVFEKNFGAVRINMAQNGKSALCLWVDIANFWAMLMLHLQPMIIH